MFKKVKNLRLSEVMNTWSVNQCRFAILVFKFIKTKKKKVDASSIFLLGVM